MDDRNLREVLDAPTSEWRPASGLRDAAVIAPLFARAGRDHLLYTVRPEHLRHHAGEVSFPGGGREGGEDAIACGLRELDEELGLRIPRSSVLGRLPERRSIAGFQVHVFVARIDPPDAIVPDASEVAEVLEIPLSELSRDERWEFRTLEDAQRRRYRVPFFEFGEHTLWGLTGRFTLDLLDRVARRDGSP